MAQYSRFHSAQVHTVLKSTSSSTSEIFWKNLKMRFSVTFDNFSTCAPFLLVRVICENSFFCYFVAGRKYNRMLPFSTYDLHEWRFFFIVNFYVNLRINFTYTWSALLKTRLCVKVLVIEYENIMTLVHFCCL